MKKRRTLLICWLSLIALVGCAGTGEVIPLQIHPTVTGSEGAAKQKTAARVAIGSFEDDRSHKTGLGSRTHLWGGVTYFDVPGGRPAEVVVQALTDYLTAKGWQVTKRGAGESEADVVLTGKLLDFSVHAKSRVGFTEVMTKTKLALQAQNVADGSTVRMTLNGSGGDEVFWFDPEDAQGLLNDVLIDSFGKLVQETTVENKHLRLKTP
ncbi:MAG TPA: hypothetical protein VLM19_05575 [Nitrospiraceae bacterium]|nr:hypothetical protein [Nitrospiraceae bacterium]